MKKLIATFAVCLGTAAFAQSAPAPSQTQIPSSGTRVDTGVNATDVGRGLNGATREASNAQAQENLFKKEHALSLKGTVKKAHNDSVDLTRKDLPDAKLDVKAQTVVMLDGKKVRADEIPEGSEVRARFQLDGDDAVAVELRATSPKKGTGGSGAVDTVKKDAKKAGDKVEQAGDDVKQDVDDAVH
ncbi:hypothetical protein LXT21_09610 [Myxococcus sp. K38C18041901]|uniref:hypothetical protein n=1 Tax=Myxococcus guangdongensis TaxID=2906760 RepID=UPI0020A7EE5F|nr:hypothetical protein [Myxococcus guangdongensis]MCP3059027.1 hypothetical protein [Myxococcus guangdongensis]